MDPPSSKVTEEDYSRSDDGKVAQAAMRDADAIAPTIAAANKADIRQ